MMSRKVLRWSVPTFLLCILLATTWFALPGSAATLPVPLSRAPQLVGAQNLFASRAEDASWRTGGPYGGDVQALALAPDFTTSGIAFAGGWRQGHYGITGGYGIARTTDRGVTWNLLGDAQHQWPVFDAAISPAFAADHVVYAGTDVGLLRSTDRGNSWLRLYGGLPDSTAGSGIDDISQVRLSPAFGDDGLLFAIQREGTLFRSVNRGDNWTRVLTGTVTAVALSKQFAADGVVFAALADIQAGTTALMRSSDRGVSWDRVLLLPAVQANDLLSTYDAALLVATTDGVLRLIPDGGTYVPDAVEPNIADPVYRLALAGDNVYAAAQRGLFISMSFGRGWEQVPGTPATPFRSVAPCPLWGSCHSVLAGTHIGMLSTTDDNLQPWQWQAGPMPLLTNGIAASPTYAADHMLFAATDHGVFRSTDGGISWQLTVAGDPPVDDYSFSQVRVAPTFPSDGTVFATFEDRTLASAALYKSTDRGQTWTAQGGIGGGKALALSPLYGSDHTVFLGRDDTLYKSTDSGSTWSSSSIATPSEGFSIFRLETSPVYGVDHTLFATGFGRVRRSTDSGATWQPLNTFGPSYGLAISPSYSGDGTVWHGYRAIESPGNGTPESGIFRSTDRGTTWSWATAGLPGVYEPFPVPLAVSPAYTVDRSLFTALSGQFVAGGHHSLYRSTTGGVSWQEVGPAPGDPNPFDLAVTQSLAPGLTVHMATSAGVWHYTAGPCEERLTNGAFETDLGWQFPDTAYPAAYSSKHAHNGARSLRAGIDGDGDKYSYSDAYQAVSIPAGVASAVLRFWWYPLSAEGSLPTAVTPERDLLQRMVEGKLPAGILAGDRQYLLLLDERGTILKSLVWTRSDARAWSELSFDLTAYRGRTLQVRFGVLNDGDGRTTAMYVDDASLTTCWPIPTGPTPTPTVTSTAGPSLPRGYLPLVLKRWTPPVAPTVTPTPSATRTSGLTNTPTATRTATISPSPTPTSVLLQDRWLRSLVAAPGENGRLYGLTNEGFLMSSTDRGQTWATVQIPPQIAGNPLKTYGYVGIDYSHPEVLYLGAGQQGLWRSGNGGGNWTEINSIQAGPVTVGLDDSSILWVGLIGPTEPFPGIISRSTDTGMTWSAAGNGFGGAAVSPLLIDPQAHNVLYGVASGPRASVGLYRTFDGIWERIPNAPLGVPPVVAPGLGLAMDSSTRGLYIGNTNGTLYVSHNAHTPNLNDVSWEAVHSFVPAYLPIPLAVGAGPDDGALYVTLYDVSSGRGRTMRSYDAGKTWAALTIPPSGVVLPTATPTATATPGPTQACYDALANGGFETDAGWIIRTNPVLSGYVNTPVHGGSRSMRTGIAQGGTNLESYSPVEQALQIPALPGPGSASTVRLSFWRYNVWGDGAATTVLGALPAPDEMPRTLAALQATTFATDFFYVIAVKDNGAIDWLLPLERVNNPTWRQITVDLSAYAGQHIRLQFGTYNNGSGGISRTYVDDVSLQVCPPPSSLVFPAGWAQRIVGRPEMNTLYAAAGGVLYRSDDAGSHWRTSGVARPEHMILSADPNVLYAGDGYPCFRGGPNVPFWRTTDAGVTWQQIPGGTNLKPLAAHPVDRRLYAAGCDGPYLSTDGGTTFAHQSDPLFNIYNITAIAPVGTAWTDVWVAGVSEGGGGVIAVSRNGGATWSRSTSLNPETGWYGDLRVDRFQAGQLFAPAFYGFFYTPDNGQAWIDNSQGLEGVLGRANPPGALYQVAEDPGAGHRLYLGTQRGLYTRNPATRQWYKIGGQAFDQLPITELFVLDGAPSRLYVTSSLGVFVYDLILVPPSVD